jgi:hypothetical protein
VSAIAACNKRFIEKAGFTAGFFRCGKQWNIAASAADYAISGTPPTVSNAAT